MSLLPLSCGFAGPHGVAVGTAAAAGEASGGEAGAVALATNVTTGGVVLVASRVQPASNRAPVATTQTAIAVRTRTERTRENIAT